jgi:hypothetical protein
MFLKTYDVLLSRNQYSASEISLIIGSILCIIELAIVWVDLMLASIPPFISTGKNLISSWYYALDCSTEKDLVNWYSLSNSGGRNERF